MRVRGAVEADVNRVVELSRRVQDRLADSGSLQQFGPISADMASVQVAAETAYILDSSDGVNGSVFFVEPAVDDLRRMLARWELTQTLHPLWFLHKL